MFSTNGVCNILCTYMVQNALARNVCITKCMEKKSVQSTRARRDNCNRGAYLFFEKGDASVSYLNARVPGKLFKKKNHVSLVVLKKHQPRLLVGDCPKVVYIVS